MAWEFCGYLIKEINAINSQDLITYTLMYMRHTKRMHWI